MTTWLVTGGAGYIGAHVVREFLNAGITPVVVDDLSSGVRSFVPAGVPFIEASLLDEAALRRTFESYAIDGVVHIAGYKYAGESVKRPLHTYEQNVTATGLLYRVALEHEVNRVVFSSSAAVYGTPDVELVTEATVQQPQSPYGETKLIGEWMLADLARAHERFHFTALRYFNVVGSGSDDVYDGSPYNLFPLVFRALEANQRPKIFGDDYPTADGTNIRDYVHVSDIAAAHVAAARRLDADQPIETAYNLGSGTGLSVTEIMSAIARVTQTDFTPEIAPRRPGDPPRIVADGALAARDLDWAMRHGLDEMVASAWNAFPRHNVTRHISKETSD